MSNPLTPFRFQIALSFPGEYRVRVERIAQALAATTGQERILYDKWHRAEFARPNLDVYLPQLYHEQSRLVVFFLCSDYAEKEWCGLELRAGRDLLKKKEDDRLMFLRLDLANIPGLYSIDGYLDISDMPDDEVAREILNRLAMLAPVARVSIDKMVSDVRTQTLVDIQEHCGKIRILTMEQPIELGGIYTDVNLLERRTANVRKTRDELIQEAKLEPLAGLGNFVQRTERIPGLKAFDLHPRIMIYGKPGAGKTTFLRRVAMECAKGNFHSELVPVFVTLKDFAETDGSPGLFSHIQRRWGGNPNSRTILRQGRALILLDGLDEVREQDFTRVRKAIESFITEFPRCSMALSCRIAAREYAFEHFSEVEMADFNKLQIKLFAMRWFDVQGEETKARTFVERLEANQPILELASNPLLLTLLLLVFQERNDFGGTRAELYREGLDILLRKWDAKRGVERDRPYGLTITDMETLLSEIAYRRFLDSEYFFDQGSLEKQIEVFFSERNLLELGQEFLAERVLNSIESHLGLLIQRAVRVYSFSHRTFQEYLAAQRLARKATLLSEIDAYVGDTRWREVWLLLVTMVDADDIIPELKKRIDMLVEKDPEIQKYLEWCDRKGSAEGGDVKAAALRAFFFDLERDLTHSPARVLSREYDLTRVLNRDRTPDGASALDVALSLDPARALDLVRDRALDLARDRDLIRECRCEISLALALESTFDHNLISCCDLELELALDLSRARALALSPALCLALGRALDRTLGRAANAARLNVPALVPELETLRVEVPATDGAPYSAWAVKLRAAAIRHRDIGNEWRFTASQTKILRDYYRANLLLVECMNAARGLTKKTRQYIEDTMLLPWNEIRSPTA